MNSNTIAIRITVKDDGSQVIQQFGANAGGTFRSLEKDSASTSSALLGIKTSYLALSAAVIAAAAAMKQAWDLAEQSAGYLEQMQLLDGLAKGWGTSSQAMVKGIQEVSDGMISMATAAEVAYGAMAKNIKPDQIQNLAKAAVTLSNVMETTVDDAFRKLTEALETGRVKTLKQAVGLIDLEARYGEAAKSMSDAEKQQAMYNIVMERATAIQAAQGDSAKDLADQMETLRVTIADLKIELGIGLIKAGAAAMASFYGLAAGINDVVIAYWRLIAAKERFQTYLSWGGKQTQHEENALKADMKASSAGISQVENLDKYWKNWDLVTASVASMTRATRTGATTLGMMGSSGTGAGEKIKKGMSDAEREIKRLNEQADKLIQKTRQEVELGGLTGLRKALRENEIEYENTIQQYEKLGGARKAELIAVELEKKAMKDQAAVAKDLEQFHKDEWAVAQELAAWKEEQAKKEEERINAQVEAYQRLADALNDLKASDSPLLDIERQYMKQAEVLMEALVQQQITLEQYNRMLDKLQAHKAQEEFSLFTDVARANIAGLRDMADGMASLYDEGSSAAKRWTDAADALEIAQRALAVVNAVTAVAAASTAPFPAGFVAGAAMLASMGALLASIGEGIGGGGGNGGGYSGPSYTGKSTVLGAADDEMSESFQNSLEILQDTYSMEYGQLRELNDQMEALNTNITGLVSSFLRTGNLGDISFSTGTFGKNNMTPLKKFDKNFMGGAGYSFFSGNWLGDLGGWNWGGKLFDKLTNWLGGFLFGGKTTVKSKGEGLGVSFIQDVTGKGLVGSYKNLADASGAGNRLTIGEMLAGQEAYVYDWAKAKIKTDGGLLGSDKTSKKYRTMAESGDVTSMFNLVFENMGGTLVELAKGLGVDINSVLAYSFASFRLDFKDKSGEEIQKIISEQISMMADTASSSLFGGLISQYQQVSEGLYETAVRLVTDKAVVEEIIGMTNQRLPDVTSDVIALSESLIDLSGGLKGLQEAAAGYFDKFYSDQEKHIYLQEQLRDVLGDLGLSLATSRAGYRAMVEALDLTTDAGQYAYVTMMQLAESADQYYSVMDESLKDNKDLFRTREDYLRAVATGKSEDTPEAKDRKEMLAEIKRLRETLEAQGLQTVKNTKRTSDVLEEWKNIGMPATAA